MIYDKPSGYFGAPDAATRERVSLGHTLLIRCGMCNVSADLLPVESSHVERPHATSATDSNGSRHDELSRRQWWLGLQWLSFRRLSLQKLSLQRDLCLLLALLVPGLAAASEAPASLDIHNSRFVYSAEEKLGDFNLTRYLGDNALWLQPYRELITHWSAYATVSPRITLALIELETQLVSTETPSSGALRRPFGDLSSSNTFGGQSEDVLRRLSRSFYSDGGQMRQPTAARRALLTVLGSEARLAEFHRSFQRIFPSLAPLSQRRNSFSDPKSTLPPPSFLQLPFPVGDTWVSNGAHAHLGQDPGPKSSLDFSRNWTSSWGANTSSDWVVAASTGTAVVHSRCFVEVIGANGWSTSYYHLNNIVVSNGTFVSKDQRLANYANSQRQALCRGDASGPHVHFSLLRKGEYASLHNALLSAYRVDVGRSSYDRDCNHFFLERNGAKFCAGSPLANQSSQLPPPESPGDLQANALSIREIELQWQDLSGTESAFEIEARQSGAFTRVAQVAANTTSYRSLGLESGAAYSFRVRAVNSAGSSGYSNVANAMTEGERSPTSLNAVTLSDDSIELSWIDRAVSETRYEVEGHLEGEDFAILRSLPSGTQSVVIDGLLPRTTYTFRVRADGTRGFSTFTSEVTATTSSEAPGPCQSGDTAMCLSQERFRVEVDWQRFDGVRGDARRVSQGTNDSGLFWFFQDQNWEMLVKVLDGCQANQHFWVFAAATTNVEYTLRITDTATGVVKTYFNPLGTAASAVTDTNAFSTCGTEQNQASDASELTAPGSSDVDMMLAPLPSVQPSDLKVGSTSPCVAGPSRLCLNQERFELTVSWEDFSGASGTGQVAPLRADDSGLFWFFDGNNWEMLAKVINGCAANGHYWVFAASTTNVGYQLSVRDTQTGMVREYSNPLGRSADAITDSEALAVCP